MRFVLAILFTFAIVALSSVMADNPAPPVVGENVQASANMVPSGGATANGGLDDANNGKTNVKPGAAPPPAPAPAPAPAPKPKPQPQPKPQPKQPQGGGGNAMNHTHADHHQSKPSGEGMETGAKVQGKNHGHDDGSKKNIHNQNHNKMEKQLKHNQTHHHDVHDHGHGHGTDIHHQKNKGSDCHCDETGKWKNGKHMNKDSIKKAKQLKGKKNANANGGVKAGATENAQDDASTAAKPPAK